MNLPSMVQLCTEYESAVANGCCSEETAFYAIALEWGINGALAREDLGGTDIWALLGYTAGIEYSEEEVMEAIALYS